MVYIENRELQVLALIFNIFRAKISAEIVQIWKVESELFFYSISQTAAQSNSISGARPYQCKLTEQAQN